MSHSNSYSLVNSAETIAWCSSHVSLKDLRHSLRTEKLCPHPLAGTRSDVVQSVAEARHVALGWPQFSPARSLANGRLLLYEPDVNLACGAAEAESNGFFDVNNVPAWDTWVWYIEGESVENNYLISWVAPQIVDVVEAGVIVNPEECIQWADRAAYSFVDMLRREGILTTGCGGT